MIVFFCCDAIALRKKSPGLTGDENLHKTRSPHSGGSWSLN
ncbi:MAG: hypothetical protein AAF889_01260 [Cyanobacteria bacterium P01_D01_bin.73]